MAGGDRAAGDGGPDELAGGALGGEVDRRRRAVLAAVDLAQPERLAEMAAAGRRSMTMTSPDALEGDRRRPCANPRAGRRRRSPASAGSRCRCRLRSWSRCRARRCRSRSGSRAPRQASAMPSMQPTNWPMISGRCGLPKFMQSVAASGRRADRAEIAPGFGDRLLAALDRVGKAIARGAVGGDGERLVGAVDPDHGRVAARRAGRCRRRPCGHIAPRSSGGWRGRARPSA